MIAVKVIEGLIEGLQRSDMEPLKKATLLSELVEQLHILKSKTGDSNTGE